jgi:hypothetical protein
MTEHKVRTKGGNIYYVRFSGGIYYVKKPGWLGNTSVASASSMSDALAIVENDAGEKIGTVRQIK